MMAVAILTVHIRRLGRVYRLEPWRAARPEPGDSVAVGFNDWTGTVFALSCDAWKRTHLHTFYHDAER